jgi:preprotein translocase subunit SecG
MLTFGIYFLTAVLVLDCILLVLLVLVQLPKKEAGMGQAFGGAATDALFGAGSGNVLTKATKWLAGLFFALSISLTIMGTFKSTGSAGRLLQLMQQNKPVAEQPAPAPAPAPADPINLNIQNNPPANVPPAPAPDPAPAPAN